MKPKLLDLFCGEGGASYGYHLAGFEVVGVDLHKKSRYPFEFHQADAFEFLREHGHEFDVIHASPPCQAYSWATPKSHRENHPDFIAPIREQLEKTGKPYIIENVGGARHLLHEPVKLCGSMFGLKTFRHRYFEVHPKIVLLTPPCRHDFQPLLVTTAGNNSRAIRSEGNYKSVKNAPLAYGIEWMSCEGLKEAIPPAYTKFLGLKVRACLTQPAPDVWDSAPLKPLSTPEVDSDLGNVPTPAPRR